MDALVISTLLIQTAGIVATLLVMTLGIFLPGRRRPRNWVAAETTAATPAARLGDVAAPLADDTELPRAA